MKTTKWIVLLVLGMAFIGFLTIVSNKENSEQKKVAVQEPEISYQHKIDTIAQEAESVEIYVSKDYQAESKIDHSSYQEPQESRNFEAEAGWFYVLMSDPDFVKEHALAAISPYSNFVHRYIKNAEKRKAVFDILEAIEKQRLQVSVDFLLGRPISQADLEAVSGVNHRKRLYENFSTVLEAEELDNFMEHCEITVPRTIRVFNSAEIRIAKGLTKSNQQILIDSLTEMQAIATAPQPFYFTLLVSELSFKEQVRKQLDTYQRLKQKIAEMESEQTQIASSFLQDKYGFLEVQNIILKEALQRNPY